MSGWGEWERSTLSASGFALLLDASSPSPLIVSGFPLLLVTASPFSHLLIVAILRFFLTLPVSWSPPPLLDTSSFPLLDVSSPPPTVASRSPRCYPLLDWYSQISGRGVVLNVISHI